MRIPLFFNNTARSARTDRFRRWLDGHRDLFDVVEPESREDMLRHLAARLRKNHAGAHPGHAHVHALRRALRRLLRHGGSEESL